MQYGQGKRIYGDICRPLHRIYAIDNRCIALWTIVTSWCITRCRHRDLLLLCLFMSVNAAGQAVGSSLLCIARPVAIAANGHTTNVISCTVANIVHPTVSRCVPAFWRTPQFISIPCAQPHVGLVSSAAWWHNVCLTSIHRNLLSCLAASKTHQSATHCQGNNRVREICIAHASGAIASQSFQQTYLYLADMPVPYGQVTPNISLWCQFKANTVASFSEQLKCTRWKVPVTRLQPFCRASPDCNQLIYFCDNPFITANNNLLWYIYTYA